VFENGELRKIFRPKREEITGSGKNVTGNRFITCTLPKYY
jgi:hypothetical protein